MEEPTYIPFSELPMTEGYELFPHQEKAITWMRKRENMESRKVYGLRGGILCLKQGLGKTLCTLAHILSAPAGKFPSLIVASKTVMYEWKTEGFEKFFPTAKVLYLHSEFVPKNILDKMNRKFIKSYDIVVTTYDYCISQCKKGKFDQECTEIAESGLHAGKVVAINQRTLFQCDRPDAIGSTIVYTTPWHRIVFDESQKFANHKTQTYKAMMALGGRYMWCLSGTPIRNYDTDIWSQMRVLGYMGVSRATDWSRSGLTLYKTHKLTEAVLNMDYQSAEIFIPEKEVHEIQLSLTPKEQEVHDYVKGILRKVFDMMLNKLCDYSCVLAIFMRLRQCAIAPWLMTPESKRKHTEDDGNDEAVVKKFMREMECKLGDWVHNKDEAGLQSSKINAVFDVIKNIPPGDKVIVFSMFTSLLDLLSDKLENEYPEFRYVTVDGDTTGDERTELLEKFRKKKKVRGLLMTYKVGSEGLNLQSVGSGETHVICVEPWWCPSVMNQAVARAHRMGQTQTVHDYRIVVSNSIEERILEICQQKEELTKAYLEGSGSGAKMPGLDKETMARILGLM